MIAEAQRRPPEPDPDDYSPQEVRDFIMGTPVATERLKELEQVTDHQRNVGEYWVKFSSNQQYSDFSDQANFHYLKEKYKWLYTGNGLVGIDLMRGVPPEYGNDTDLFISTIPDDEWESFIEDAKTASEGECLDDDKANDLEMEAAEEWWKPPHGGYDDYLRELKLRFRNGRISHMLDDFSPWELLEIAGKAGHYIERQGEGSVWMDCEKAAKDTDIEDIEKVANERVAWHARRDPVPGEPPPVRPKDAHDLQKDWEDRKRAAWQGEVGREFKAALGRLVAHKPDWIALLNNYTEHDLWQVFNKVVDDEVTDKAEGAFWWTWPQTTTHEGVALNQPPRTVEPQIHLTTYREPGHEHYRRWEAKDWTKAAADEAAADAWENYIRYGRKMVVDDPRQTKLQFEAQKRRKGPTDPKDFIAQTPEPVQTYGAIRALTDSPGLKDFYSGESHPYLDFNSYVVPTADTADEPHDANKAFWGWEFTLVFSETADVADDDTVLVGTYGGYYVNVPSEGWIDGRMDIPPEVLPVLEADFHKFLGLLNKYGIIVPSTIKMENSGGPRVREPGDHLPVAESVDPKDFIQQAVEPRYRLRVGVGQGAERQEGYVTLMPVGFAAGGTRKEAARLSLEAAQMAEQEFTKHGWEVAWELAESVNAKDYINQQPEPHKMGDLVELRCPHCGDLKLLARNWPDNIGPDWGTDCEKCSRFIPLESAVLAEGVEPSDPQADPKDFIEQVKTPGPDDLSLWTTCPACQRRWSITMRAQRVYSGTNVVCPCGHRIPADQFESADPKEFIMAQPEFWMKFHCTRNLGPKATPHEIERNMEALGWRSVYMSEPSPEQPSWEIRFNRSAKNEIRYQRGDKKEIDAQAFSNLVSQIVYHFRGWVGVDMKTDDIDYDYIATVTQLTNESVDPKDFILAQPDPFIKERSSAPGDPQEYVQYDCFGNSGDVRRMSYSARSFDKGATWLVYSFDGAMSVKLATFNNKEEAVALARRCADEHVDWQRREGEVGLWESVDAKDFIMDQPDPLVKEVVSEPGHSPEYVQYDCFPKDYRHMRYLAQSSGPHWFVYEVSAGEVLTLTHFDNRAEAVALAKKYAEMYVNVGRRLGEAVYRGGQDPDAMSPQDVRDWVLTGGPDVGEVLLDTPDLYVIIPKDKETFEKYLPRDKWKPDIGDHIIVVPDPEERVPVAKGAEAGENLDNVGLREWYHKGLEVFSNGTTLQEVFSRSYGPALQKALTKHYQAKAKRAPMEGAEGDYEKYVTCLMQVGGHKAMRGHYRHIKPGLLRGFDWQYGISLAQKGRLRAAARWLGEPREKVTKEGIWAAFDDWQDTINLFENDRHINWRSSAESVFNYENDHWFDYLLSDEHAPSIQHVTSALPPAAYPVLRNLLAWARINPGDWDWEGVPLQPDGTILLTPQLVSQFTDDQIEGLLDNHDEFDADGRLKEIAEGLIRGMADSDVTAHRDAYYEGYTKAVESALGSKHKWIKVGGKDKLGFLIPWATVNDLLMNYYEANGEPFDDSIEALVISHSSRAQPSEEYTPNMTDVLKLFKDTGWEYGLDQIEELEPPEPVQIPGQPELFEPEGSYAPVNLKRPTAPPAAPPQQEGVDPKDFITGLQPVRLRYVPGERVKTNMGTRQSGVIVKHFYWQGSTDGTYKPPTKRDVPVRWDNGTRGYINKIHLSPELTQPGTMLGESLLMEGYKYACVMIELPPEHADFLFGWGKLNIPDDALHQPPEGDSMGREMEAHVTVKYGITLNEVPHELHLIAQKTPAFPVYIGKVSLFQQADYDVVKLDVESPWLRQLNARITKALPCEGDTYPVYHPHVTLAYVKKGSCDQLVGQDPFAGEGNPGAEFVAYGMLFKGASEVEDDPARVKEHLLFNKTKKAEPPLDKMEVAPVAEGVNAKDFILTSEPLDWREALATEFGFQPRMMENGKPHPDRSMSFGDDPEGLQMNVGDGSQDGYTYLWLRVWHRRNLIKSRWYNSYENLRTSLQKFLVDFDPAVLEGVDPKDFILTSEPRGWADELASRWGFVPVDDNDRFKFLRYTSADGDVVVDVRIISPPSKQFSHPQFMVSAKWGNHPTHHEPVYGPKDLIRYLTDIFKDLVVEGLDPKEFMDKLPTMAYRVKAQDSSGVWHYLTQEGNRYTKNKDMAGRFYGSVADEIRQEWVDEHPGYVATLELAESVDPKDFIMDEPHYLYHVRMRDAAGDEDDWLYRGSEHGEQWTRSKALAWSFWGVQAEVIKREAQKEFPKAVVELEIAREVPRIGEGIDPKEFIEQNPGVSAFRVKVAFSKLGTNMPDIYIGHWGKASVEPPNPFMVEHMPTLIPQIEQHVRERYGEQVLRLLTTELVFEESGPYAQLPFPSNPAELIRFLKHSQKRPQKTLL